ncbi:MAG: nitrilase family protein [Bacteroidetes bacterium]|nr:nitrilase family protein [Bacteroidota bacterium]
MQDLNVTIIQTKLHWEDVDANLALFDAKLEQITTASDLIVLPEMFNTGFSMNAQNLSERMDGKSINWMKEKAKLMNQVVTGSLIIEDEGKYFNRLIWMRPDGTHVHYDKRHLFRMAGEHHHFSSGSEQVVVELNGWKICLLVCYDLRFPVWSRNKGNYDAVIYIANWPERRSTS